MLGWGWTHSLTLCRADTVWKDEPFFALPLPLSTAMGKGAEERGISGRAGRQGAETISLSSHFVLFWSPDKGFQHGGFGVSTPFCLTECILYALGHTMTGKWQNFATDVPRGCGIKLKSADGQGTYVHQLQRSWQIDC